MNDLLLNPAVQAAVAPFVAAFVVALLLARTRYLAAAVAVGLLMLLYLTIGFSLEPLTSVRRSIVVTLAASGLALGLEAAGVALRRPMIAALSAAFGLASIWVVERILVQQPPAAAWLAGLGAFVFVLALVAGALASGDDPLQASVVGVALGWGSGALAVLGASALLGQIGIALGTSCAAIALAQMLRGRAPSGWTIALPASAGAGLVGVLACATGELHWYFLAPLGLVPLAAKAVPAGRLRPWQYPFVAGLAALVPVVVAIAWARTSARAAASAG